MSPFHRAKLKSRQTASLVTIAALVSTTVLVYPDSVMATGQLPSCTKWSSKSNLASLADSGAGSSTALTTLIQKPLVKITKTRWSADGQRLIATVRWNKKAILKSGVHAKSVNLVAIGPYGVTTIPFKLTGPYSSRITLTEEQIGQVQQASSLAVAATQRTRPNAAATYFEQAYVAVAYLKGGPTGTEQSVPLRACSHVVIEASGNLSGCQLTGINLSGMRLNDADFTGADLTGARISKRQIKARTQQTFSNALSKQPDCIATDTCDGADLHNTNLAGANLAGVSMQSVNLTGANLTGANMWNADLTAAVLDNATLIRTGLRGANLGSASLKRACLQNADLSPDSTGYANPQTYLPGADFSGSDLSNAKFTSAEMAASILKCTNVTATDFTGADLTNVDFNHAGPFAKAKSFADVQFNSGTTCPNGSTSEPQFCPSTTWSYDATDGYCSNL